MAVPWLVDGHHVVIPDRGFRFMVSGGSQREAEANAELVVRAVNHHDALVAALEVIAYKPIGQAEASFKEVYWEIVEVARAAIANARTG